MKKSLKLVGIFMIVLVVGVVGGISLYLLIANNKTYYVYDVRIVKPIESQAYYVYTDSGAEYELMKNQTCYLTSPEENNFEIGIYAHTSTGTTKVDVKSSNTDVAAVIANNGKLFVNYRSAGEAEITASVGGVVQDTIKVSVYDISAEDVSVFDDKYYGREYSKYFTNKVVLYADSSEYSYRIETSNVAGGEFSDNINCELLAIDYDHINKNIFKDNSSVKIDPESKTLVLKCNKEDVTGNVDEIIPIQVLGKNSEGETRVVTTYFVKVHIISNTPEFLQIVLSKSPHFDEGMVFMDTVPVDVSNLTDDEIKDDPSILNEFLKYQIAESGLNANKENSVYKVYFTENVSKIYLKIRKVYTNGEIVELNPNTLSENPHTISATDASYLKPSTDNSYYVLSLSKADFFANTSNVFKINVSLGDYELEHEFEFEYAELDESSISKFYTYNSDNGTYTYTYWDERNRYGEVYGKQGEIIGIIVNGSAINQEENS